MSAPSSGPGSMPSSAASRLPRTGARGGPLARHSSAATISSRPSSRWTSMARSAFLPRGPGVAGASVARSGVLAARGEPVGARQHRDLDLYRLAAAQVAVDRRLVERALVHEEAEHEGVARDRAEELAQLLARAQPAADARDHLLAHGVVADERDAAVRQHLACGRLRDVVGERAEAERLGARELVRERFVEQLLYARTELRAEDHRRMALDPQLLAQHLERVTVHVEVVEVALLYAVEGGELGQHGGDEAEAVGEGEPFEHALGDHESAELGEDALRRGLGHGVRRLER